MKRTTDIKPKLKFSNFNIIIFLIFAFVCGLIFGLINFNAPFLSFKQTLPLQFLSVRKGKDYLGTLFSVILNYLPYVLLLYLSGVSLIGIAVSFALLSYSGFYLGTLITHFIVSLGLMGVLFDILIVVIPFLPYFLTLLFSSRETYGFSLCIARLVFPFNNGNINLYSDFLLYTKRQFILILIFLASTAFDALISSSFIKLFNL